MAMMSHISRMCSRMSSGRPSSGRFIVGAGVLLFRPLVGGRLVGPGRLGPLSRCADARQILVEPAPVGGADPPVEGGRFFADPVEDALVPAVPRLSNRLSNARDRLSSPSGPARRRSCQLMCRAVGHRDIRLVVAHLGLLNIRRTRLGCSVLVPKMLGEDPGPC